MSERINDYRVETLKAMHTIMSMDDGTYEEWIRVVPDEPSDDDFKYIAEDNDLYYEAKELFKSLVKCI